MKTCNACFRLLPLDSFYRASRAKDGHDWSCKTCSNAYRQASAQKRRIHGPSPTGTRHSGAPRHRVEPPEQRTARHMVADAIESGSLQRQPCEICGAADDVQAHHDDYSKPLDVRWLCDFHHRLHHREAARAMRAAQRVITRSAAT